MHVINLFLMNLNYIKQYMKNLRSHTDLCMYIGLIWYDTHILTCKGFKISDPN
jgi:hypothetical protein